MWLLVEDEDCHASHSDILLLSWAGLQAHRDGKSLVSEALDLTLTAVINADLSGLSHPFSFLFFTPRSGHLKAFIVLDVSTNWSSLYTSLRPATRSFR
jgi:hypothetical protein